MISKITATHPFEHIFPVITEFHEQRHFPASVAVDRINLQCGEEERKQDSDQSDVSFFKWNKIFAIRHGMINALKIYSITSQ